MPIEFRDFDWYMSIEFKDFDGTCLLNLGI